MKTGSELLTIFGLTVNREWLTVNCYFMKITTATSSVICDFDNDGSDSLLQTAHYSTLLRETSILRELVPSACHIRILCIEDSLENYPEV